MLAVYIESFEKSGNVKVGQVPVPKVNDEEVLIKVAFAGVNPVDAKIAEGLLQNRMPHEFPIILGWEASGVVEEVGAKVEEFKQGDFVYTYCRKPKIQWGTYAEFVSVASEHVALIPKNLSLSEAAGVPLAGLTAWQALLKQANLKKGETVLIHAGGGGVGSFAIQWAKIHLATVITTASESKEGYVKSLGADEVIDYRKCSFKEKIRQNHPKGIDVVLDTVGKETYRDSFSVLKPGGRIVSILEQPNRELEKQFQVHAFYHFVTPDGAQLKEFSWLFEKGLVKIPHISERPLSQAAEVVEEIRRGRSKGKMVLRVSA